MPLRTYVLLIILFSLLGLCTVHEVTRQTEARYRIARMLADEQRLREEAALLQKDLAALKDPARLERLNREMDLRFRPLRPLACHGFENPSMSARDR